MRFLLIILLVLSLQSSDTTRIRLLLRDKSDAGVGGATLLLRLEGGQTLQLVTDANGVALSDPLAGKVVWLTSGRRSDGNALIADSYPASSGFRLVLIPDQTRNALLRLDGARIVLDPDMIFAPGAPGEPAPAQALPTAMSLATPLPLAPVDTSVAGLPPAGQVPPVSTPVAPAASSASALWIIWWVLGVGVVLVALAFLIGLARRRVQ